MYVAPDEIPKIFVEADENLTISNYVYTTILSSQVNTFLDSYQFIQNLTSLSFHCSLAIQYVIH